MTPIEEIDETLGFSFSPRERRMAKRMVEEQPNSITREAWFVTMIYGMLCGYHRNPKFYRWLREVEWQ